MDRQRQRAEGEQEFTLWNQEINLRERSLSMSALKARP